MKSNPVLAGALFCFVNLAGWHSSQPARPAWSALPVNAGATTTCSAQKQVAVAPGANTEDPRAILRAAQEAVSRIHTLTYNAVSRGEGASSVGPVITGQVALEKLAPGNPLLSKMEVHGTFFGAGSNNGVKFSTAFDGATIFKLLPQEKTLLRRTVANGNPAENQLAFVASFFGGGAYQLIFFPLIMPGLIVRVAERPVVQYAGKTVINGVLCHVIYAQDKGGEFKEWWYIGVKDKLPRELESVGTDAEGRWGAGVLELSHLRPNEPLTALAFRIARPAGYAVKTLEQHKPPKLLAAGTAAPDWKLSGPGGHSHTLAQYRGRIVVMDFWGTWCAPCVRSLPGLEKLYEEYSGRGVVFFGVDSWEESNPVAYMKQEHYRFPILLKGETIAKAYHVVDVPVVYIIGADGKVVYSGAAPDEQVLSAVIRRYLADRGR